jgi:hypothetical protein
MSIMPPEHAGELRAHLPPMPDRVPNSIVGAALFMWIGALVYLVAFGISAVHGLGDVAGLRDSIRDEDPSLSASQLDLEVASVVLGGVIGWVGSVMLWVWMGWKNWQGRRWARNVATALGAINLAFLIWGLAFYQSMTQTIVSLLTMILGPLAIALLWNKESADYYRAVRAARRAHGLVPK